MAPVVSGAAQVSGERQWPPKTTRIAHNRRTIVEPIVVCLSTSLTRRHVLLSIPLNVKFISRFNKTCLSLHSNKTFDSFFGKNVSLFEKQEK